VLGKAARQERQVKQRAAATLLGRDIRRGYGGGAREAGRG